MVIIELKELVLRVTFEKQSNLYKIVGQCYKCMKWRKICRSDWIAVIEMLGAGTEELE
ncbi:MAG: hypothetical protein ACXAEU_24625 [Candidatus Hodarchaeales archaeon]|jgi:hypothetical protein